MSRTIVSRTIVLCAALFGAASLVQPIASWAVPISLQAGRDATIFENAFLSGGNGATNSNGAGPGMFAGSNSNQSPRRGLLSFDVSAIPTGSTITSAQVQLTVGQIAGSGGSGSGGDQITRTIDLFKLNTDWGQGTTGSTATMIGGTGQGFPGNPGDATWTDNKLGQSQWTTPGALGNTDGVASASTQIQGGLPVGGAQNQTFTWGSTPQLVADVQSWVNNPSINFGWLIKNVDEVDNPATPSVNEGFQTFRAFYTKEAEAQGLGTGPRLLLEYTPTPVPVPAAVWLFGSGLAAIVGLARRNINQKV
ncbi:MAG: VPLPA-CTERM sorting domain-containing protein [Nitrospira sp.]|nr:VPLPA-CTERM sorting domain-containing protein [Nitrospira sp.]